MEASKCPKCGDEPHFVEQLEKWYCYGCNSYVEDGESHVHEEHTNAEPLEAKASEIAHELEALEDEDKPSCKKCGAILEKDKSGATTCPICEAPPDKPLAGSTSSAEVPANNNEAQALLDSITVAPPIEPLPVRPRIEVPEAKKEPSVEIKMCPTCGQPLKYIEKYQRHYCYGCRKYTQKGAPEKQVSAPVPAAAKVKNCPECGKQLTYIEKYSEHYCHTCKKYPLKETQKTGDLKCPKCGDRLRYIEKYSRHYCLACKEYAPKGYGHGKGEKKTCPCCQGPMSFVSEYNEWYCYKCKKYSLRPNKPVLLI